MTVEAHAAGAARALTAPAAAPRLGLLHGFQLRLAEGVVELPPSAQRLLAFLALQRRPVQRMYVAGHLWLDSSEERATASLRTALWRLRVPGCRLVDATGGCLALAADVLVDAREALGRAQRLVYDTGPPDAADLSELCDAGELLPDWYDDWVLLERERLHQLRLHALEALCRTLTAAERFGEAAEAGIAAVAAEPLRESAHLALIELHTAEGNAVEAIRQYRVYSRILHDQLQLEPSPRIQEVVAPLLKR